MFVGPRLTSADIEAPEVVHTPYDGLTVTKQTFSDGSIYEIRSSRGVPFVDLQSCMGLVPEGAKLMSVQCPWDVDDLKDDGLYIAAWSPGGCR
jgi:hypothetical protein